MSCGVSRLACMYAHSVRICFRFCALLYAGHTQALSTQDFASFSSVFFRLISYELTLRKLHHGQVFELFGVSEHPADRH